MGIPPTSRGRPRAPRARKVTAPELLPDAPAKIEPAAPPPACSWPADPLPFLQALTELSLHGVGISDPAGIIRYTNAVCQNIYGLKRDEIIGRHFRDFYADPLALQALLAQARSQGRVDHFPILAKQRDGTAIPVEVSLIRLHDASRQLLGSVAVIHDRRHPEDLVSQMQKQEMALLTLNRNLELANLELERANRLKDEFLANTSHELRTPLSAILGFLRIVLDKMCNDPAEEREFLQNAYDSAKNLLDLINELLDTAKIEAGKVDLNLVKVDIAAVFAEINKLCRVQAAQKGLRLIFQPPRAMVRADPDKLHQILLNLVANAIKFTQAGEVEVTARPFRSKGHVRFEIRDTGIGIPQEIQRDLFKKFVQGDGSTARKYGGSGLGLAICKNLVEFMGGRIWLSSPGSGQGATFYFTLPLISETPFHWRRREDRERGLKIQGDGAGPLVLVVEDEPKVVEVMTRILNKSGYRTAYAVTADDGLEGARRLHPNLITIDMGLPARPQSILRHGLDLCAALQKDPQTTAIPLILVTGHDASLDQEIKEMPPILTKPFRAPELLAKLGALLAKGQTGR